MFAPPPNFALLFFFSKFLLDITVVLKETKKNAHTLKVLLLLKVL